MSRHYDFYDSLDLDRAATTADLGTALDARIEQARGRGLPDDSPELEELLTARRILGEEERRARYDERLRAGDSAPAMGIPELRELAATGVLPGGDGAPGGLADASAGASAAHSARTEPSMAPGQIPQGPPPAYDGMQAHPPADGSWYPSAGEATGFPQAQPTQQPGMTGRTFAAIAPRELPRTLQIAFWLWFAAAIVGLIISLAFKVPTVFPMFTLLIAFLVVRRQANWVPIASALSAVMVLIISYVESAIPTTVTHMEEFLESAAEKGAPPSGDDWLGLGEIEQTIDGLDRATVGIGLLPAFGLLLVMLVVIALIAAVVMQWLNSSVAWYHGIEATEPPAAPAARDYSGTAPAPGGQSAGFPQGGYPPVAGNPPQPGGSAPWSGTPGNQA